jgi:hypothetical protein
MFLRDLAPKWLGLIPQMADFGQYRAMVQGAVVSEFESRGGLRLL